ncbi:hypothetical protein [Kordiimonas sp. SCSIO 12610]|uniref:hypothetical protein n=1 Tax=Kordiimonas sp. SCSIO 12610 TaxID=2829597 RepID=UPI00210E1D5D|nr:hypothetical protein [Kordiimonas sp. SCSIO 12610]UTW56396.1 hypothetical protein KFF44_05690 [Kordiimonas sp. SCSIO 12610]
MKKLIVAPLFLSLGACSIFGGGDGDEIIFDTALGPETKLQIRELDEGLVGDSENAQYLPEERKGNNLESEDGSQ